MKVNIGYGWSILKSLNCSKAIIFQTVWWSTSWKQLDQLAIFSTALWIYQPRWILLRFRTPQQLRPHMPGRLAITMVARWFSGLMWCLLFLDDQTAVMVVRATDIVKKPSVIWIIFRLYIKVDYNVNSTWLRHEAPLYLTLTSKKIWFWKWFILSYLETAKGALCTEHHCVAYIRSYDSWLHAFPHAACPKQ